MRGRNEPSARAYTTQMARKPLKPLWCKSYLRTYPRIRAVYAWLSSFRGNAPNSANVCAGMTSKRTFFSLNVRGEKAPPPLNKNKSFSFSLTGGDPSENRGGVGIAFRRKGRGGEPCVAVVLWLDFNVSASAEACEVSACPTAVHKLGAPVTRLHRGAWWAL